MLGCFQVFKSTSIKGIHIIFDLIKIMIPTLLVVKILEIFGIIKVIGNLLEPLMSLVGLPGNMGLVWATAIVTNIYGGIAVFFLFLQNNLDINSTITIAQTTVIMSMMLFVHSLPIEQKIIYNTGLKFFPITLFRIFFGFIYGILLFHFYLLFDLFQTPLNHLLLKSSLAMFQEKTKVFTFSLIDELLSWSYHTLQLMLSMSLIIMLLVYFLKLLEIFKINDYLLKVLGGLLKPFKIEKKISSLTTIGMLLGITYGGGLIINEIKTKEFNQKDIFLVMALLSLSHSLIEDTLIVLATGAHFSGVFWGRIVFSYFIIFILSIIIHNLNQNNFKSWFFQSKIKKSATSI